LLLRLKRQRQCKKSKQSYNASHMAPILARTGIQREPSLCKI
jgi:hypothetical protein